MKTLIWMLGASMGVLATTGAANAQEDNSADVGEIIVTAQKRAQNLQDVPISVAAVTADVLEKSSISTLDAVQHLTPGMSMSTVGSGFVSYTYIRGGGTNVVDSGSDPSVAYFKDEVYLAGTAGLQFDLLDVERVEVLKGPQGTLFGRNASVGAISIITKRPSKTFDAWVTADIGNYDFYAVRGGVTGPLVADGSWRYRLAGAHRQRGAYTENPVGRDPGFIDTYTGLGQLQYVGNKIDFLLSGDYFTADNGMTNQFLATADPSGIITPGAAASLPTDQSTFQRYYNVDGFEKQNTYMISGRLEWNLPFAILTSISAYRYNHFKRLQDQDGTLADANQLGTDQKDKTFSQELRLSNSDAQWSWVVGAYFFKGNTNRLDELRTGPDFAFPVFQNSLGLYGQILNIKSYAAFGQATYNLTDRLSVTIGGRYTRDEKESRQDTDPLGPVPAFQVHLKPHWDSFDPAAIFEFKPSEEAMIYASYKYGFKSGGFQSLPSSQAIASTTFSPEHVKSIEFGAKTQWFDRRLVVNLALFRTLIQDQQILRFVGLIGATDNAGKTKTDGIDLSVSAKITNDFRIDFNTTLQKARFVNYLTGCSGTPPTCALNFNGNHQLRSPDLSTSVIAEYAIPIGEIGYLTLRGDYSYQTKAYYDAANTKKPNTFQPSYGIANARITISPSKENWDFSLFAKNLTGKKYFRNVGVSGLSSVAVPGDPFTFGVSLNWRLGERVR